MRAPRGTLRTGRRPLADAVFDEIVTALLKGHFAPDEVLHEDDLMAWLGVTRTTLRTALEHLAERGFVHVDGPRRVRVAPADPAALAYAWRVAFALHARAVSALLPEADDATRAEFMEAIHRLRDHVERGEDHIEALKELMSFFTERHQNEVLRRASTELNARLIFLARAMPARSRPETLLELARRLELATHDGDGAAAHQAIDRFAAQANADRAAQTARPPA
ncbi:MULTISPECIES: GntR family transcriptional regulator [unclassified Isoptericola]|uniref:GntR family transcriptional regulator n=1 Tax=Isoptericola sp. NPDC057191 TaxID=3346041 RepID=UPI003629EC32